MSLSARSLRILFSSRFRRSIQSRFISGKMTTFDWHPNQISKAISKILVFGAGNFGSCLADHLADSEHSVFLWSREEEVVKSLNEKHRNPKYLKDHVFPEGITAIGPEFPNKEVVDNVDAILFAIPTQGLRPTLTALQSSLNRDALPLFIFVNKGIEQGTNALSLEIIADTCGKDVARVSTFIVRCSACLPLDSLTQHSPDHHLPKKARDQISFSSTVIA